MTMLERSPTTNPMTFEAAAQLDSDDHGGEIVDGTWVPVTRTTWRHGEIVLTIGMLLKLYARQHAGWSVAVADPGVRLSRNPDKLRGPDVGMVRAHRAPTGKGMLGWLDGAPDLAVEVVSDGQTISEMTRKALDYIAGGALMVWLVDPEPRRVVLFTPPNQVRILGPEDTIDGGDVLPGFACCVSEFFQ